MILSPLFVLCVVQFIIILIFSKCIRSLYHNRRRRPANRSGGILCSRILFNVPVREKTNTSRHVNTKLRRLPTKKNRNSSVLVTCLPHCFARRRLIMYNMVYRWYRGKGSDTNPVLNRVKSLYDLLKSS